MSRHLDDDDQDAQYQQELKKSLYAYLAKKADGGGRDLAGEARQAEDNRAANTFISGLADAASSAGSLGGKRASVSSSKDLRDALYQRDMSGVKQEVSRLRREDQDIAQRSRVAQAITGIERQDDARQKLYADLEAKRSGADPALVRKEVADARLSEATRHNKAMEEIARDRGQVGSGREIVKGVTSPKGKVLLSDRQGNFVEADLPTGFEVKDKEKSAAGGDLKHAPDGGLRLSANDLKGYGQGREVASYMDDVERLIGENEGIMGPVQGRLGALNPYDNRAQNFNSDMLIVAQRIGSYLEGGVLRKEDEAKYLRMLPSISDQPSVARYKAKQVKALLDAKHASDLDALRAQGYSAAGLEKPAASTAAPAARPAVSKKPVDEMTEEEIDAELGGAE